MNQNLPSILIADDDDDDRFMLRRALEKADVKNPVLTFTDGEDLIEFLGGESQRHMSRPEGCGLLFLDLNMPRMTGFDVLAAMRRNGQGTRLRTVVVSGSARDEDIDRAKQLGAFEYLVKFPAPEVLAKIVRAVSGTTSLPLNETAREANESSGRSDAA